MQALAGAMVALAAVALVTFLGVAWHELQYAADHPFRYGPARVIAVAAGAGATLSAATMAGGLALLRESRRRENQQGIS